MQTDEEREGYGEQRCNNVHTSIHFARAVMEVFKTQEFLRWVKAIKDKKAIAHIAARIDNIKRGVLGDVKALDEGLHEIRIDYGQGYRLYFALKAETMILLLAGGTKARQQTDIERARKILARVKKEGWGNHGG